MPRKYQSIIQDTVDPSTANNTYEIGQQWTNITSGDTFVLQSQTYGVSALWCKITILYQEDIIPIEFCADGVVVAPDAAEDYTNTNAKLRVRKFAGGAVNDIIFQWPVPKYMDVTVKPQFLVEYVISEAAPAATKVVAFSLAGYCVVNGDDTNAAFGAAVESSKTYGAGAAQNDRDTTAQSGDVTVTNLAAGGLAFFNLARLGTTTDDYAEKVAVTNVKIFWKRL
jgi:hypothetical protein